MFGAPKWASGISRRRAHPVDGDALGGSNLPGFRGRALSGVLGSGSNDGSGHRKKSR